LVVALTSPGPVLFVQERVGHRGRTFPLIKFRTMRIDAESATGPVLSAGKQDPRMTPVGRWLRLFRLDEIPQLINVVRGEMSLVGPRPERPHFVEQFAARNPVYLRRHGVRPGITGLAQLHGGYHTDARDKLRFDLFYAAHHSLLLDISVLARTVLKIVVRPDGC
jgi:lipopolysaccharide/colanic/teichoic acid biosynthesis glycosyltransferase